MQQEQLSKNKINDMQIIKFDNQNQSFKIKIKKKKKITPKYLIIFDDLSIELKKKNVPYLLKTFRHYKSKVILSTQYLSDIDPQSRMQIDFWILLKNHTEEKLAKIFPDIGCNINFDQFYKIYKDVTSKAFNFLFIDKNTCEIRENFTNEIIIE